MSEITEPSAAGDGREVHELVTCLLGGIELGLEIRAVREIVRMPRITRVPRTPHYVEGIANLRGDVLPVVNSRARFGLPASENHENDRVVVLELGGRPTGIIVDAVREVINAHPEDLEPAPPVVQCVQGRFIKGVLKLQGGKRIVLVLDHDQILEEVPAISDARMDGTLASRLAEAAEGGPPPAADEEEHLVTFRLGEEEYAVAITDVQEIIRVPPISLVPSAPPGVVGVTSLRNRVLPVMDLRTIFGMPTQAQETEALVERVRGCLEAHQRWYEELEAAVEEGAAFTGSTEPMQCEWGRFLATAQSGDPLVAATLQGMTRQHDELHHFGREVNRVLAQSGPEAARTLLRRAGTPMIEAYAAHRRRAMAALKRRDDARCLVVELGRQSVALRVDSVRQVLHTSKKTVESTPGIVAGGGARRQRLRGIAKLEGGKRLIMLLSLANLVDEQELTAMTQTDASQSGMETASSHGAQESEERHLVGFRVDSEEFAVDIMLVQEIIRLGKVTRVPQSPDFVEGVVNLRGNVLPLLDLRKRVHMPPAPTSDSTRVVVLDLHGAKTGIIVDSVSEVMRVHRRLIEPTPAVVRSRFGDQMIEGVGKLDRGDRMFLLLRPEELLTAV